MDSSKVLIVGFEHADCFLFQLPLTCPKSTMETPEQYLKSAKNMKFFFQNCSERL